MMMRKFSKKALAATTATVFLAGGGVAYSYWTLAGSDTDTAATGTSSPIVATQTDGPTNLRASFGPRELFGTFTNLTDGPVYVTSVTASIVSVSGGDGTCEVSDYTLTNPVALVGRKVAVGSDVDAWSGPDIQFNKTSTSQDGCRGATVNLTYTVL